VYWSIFTADAADVALELWVNGVYETSHINFVFGGYHQSNTIAYEKRFNAGDKVSFRLSQDSGVNQSVTGALGTQTFSVSMIHN
jgi:hypothetical protein